MRRHSVFYREDAIADLSDIYRWVYEASRDPGVAKRFADRIIASCERLGDAPFIGLRRDDLMQGIRTLSFERRGVIAYVVEGGAVHVVNVFYGGRDYDAFYAAKVEKPSTNEPPSER